MDEKSVKDKFENSGSTDPKTKDVPTAWRRETIPERAARMQRELRDIARRRERCRCRCPHCC